MYKYLWLLSRTGNHLVAPIQLEDPNILGPKAALALAELFQCGVREIITIWGPVNLQWFRSIYHIEISQSPRTQTMISLIYTVSWNAKWTVKMLSHEVKQSLLKSILSLLKSILSLLRSDWIHHSCLMNESKEEQVSKVSHHLYTVCNQSWKKHWLRHVLATKYLIIHPNLHERNKLFELAPGF